jgi:four helix bundle protein
MSEPIVSFRDLDAWKVAMDLGVLVYELVQHIPSSEKYELSAQMRRASVSIPSNVAEGQSYGTDGRYLHHVNIAIGSLGELETQLEFCRRLRFVGEGNLHSVEQQLARARQLLYGLRRSLRKRRLVRVGRSLALLGGLLLGGGLFPILG